MVFQLEWSRKYPDSIDTLKKFAPTLLEIRSLFTDAVIYSKIMEIIPLEKYQGLRAFWEEILPNYKKSRSWSEIRQGFDNKISQLLTGVLFYTFAQSFSRINFKDILRDSRILLVNLSSKNIGEEGMGLLGSFLMAKAWFESKRVRKENRKPFVVYADEFQNFATSDFSSALSEARKFKLELILAHQFFKQLPDEVFHAVMGNVKSKVYYRSGLEDAPMISKELQGRVLEQEVMEMPEFHANVKIGEDVFSLYVPKEREDNFSEEYVEDLVKKAYLDYGKDVGEIERNIRERREWIKKGCLPHAGGSSTFNGEENKPIKV